VRAFLRRHYGKVRINDLTVVTAGPRQGFIGAGSRLIALDRKTGALLWETKVMDAAAGGWRPRLDASGRRPVLRGRPLGARSRSCVGDLSVRTSWPTTTARFSPICNASWQSAWGCNHPRCRQRPRRDAVAPCLGHRRYPCFSKNRSRIIRYSVRSVLAISAESQKTKPPWLVFEEG
jgi:hypothetical protein